MKAAGIKISILFRQPGVLIYESMILEVTGMKIGKENLIESQVMRELADDDLNQAAGIKQKTLAHLK